MILGTHCPCLVQLFMHERYLEIIANINVSDTQNQAL